MTYQIEPAPEWKNRHRFAHIVAPDSKTAATMWAKQIYGPTAYAIAGKQSPGKSIYGHDDGYFYIHVPIPGGSEVVDRIFTRTVEVVVAVSD